MSEMTAPVAGVTLYTLSGCLYCSRARRLLRRPGIAFREISGDGQRDFRRRLLTRTGGATVPQVLIDGEPVGGSDALAALDHAGVLLPRVDGDRFPHAVVRRRWSLRGRGRYRVAVCDRDGAVLSRQGCTSRQEAGELASTLNTGAGSCS